MSYPTPQEFCEAIAARPRIDRVTMRIETTIVSESGFDSGVAQSASLIVESERRTYAVPDIAIGLEGRVVRVWFPDDAPHWAAVAISIVRDEWPV